MDITLTKQLQSIYTKPDSASHSLDIFILVEYSLYGMVTC
jgi:hypothetical protein